MKKLMGLMIVCCLLTGCSRVQLEDRLLVVSLAVDAGETGGLSLTVQAPNAAQATGSSDGSEKDQGASGHTLITVEGENWLALSDALEEQSPHALSFSQLRQIVVSRQVAQGDAFLPLMKSLAGEHQVRANAQVVITPESGKAFLQTQKPDVGQHLGKYLDTVLKNQISKDNVPDASLALVVRDWHNSGKDPPLITAQVGEDEKITYLGSALTRDGRVIGELSAEETRLLALLEGGGRDITLSLEDGRKVEITARSGAHIQANEDTIAVEISVTAYVPAREQVETVQVEAALRQELAALIGKLQQLNSDAAGLERHKTTEAWHFAEAQVMVIVKAQVVVRQGL